MVSIIILAIAILPMVGMFDMGLNSATTGSNYDKARALANLKMEEAKSLPFATVRGRLSGEREPPTAARATYRSDWIARVGPGERRLHELSSTGSRSST